MIRILGQLIGMLLGAMFSPSWMLLKMTLTNYFNLDKAMSGPLQFLAEFQHFNMMTLMHTDEVLYQLFPKLIAIVILGAVFVGALSRLCGYLACLLADRVKVRLAAS